MRGSDQRSGTAKDEPLLHIELFNSPLPLRPPLGIAAGVWAVSIVGLLVIGRRTAARQLATLLPNLVGLFHALLRDPRVPRGSKVLLGFAIAWFVSPIDLVPEFVPVLGPLDDAVVAALVLRHVLRKAGPDVIAEHWSGDQATLDVLLRVAGTR